MYTATIYMLYIRNLLIREECIKLFSIIETNNYKYTIEDMLAGFILHIQSNNHQNNKNLIFTIMHDYHWPLFISTNNVSFVLF
jgi:uncharacterized spore protein YtfJ